MIDNGLGYPGRSVLSKPDMEIILCFLVFCLSVENMAGQIQNKQRDVKSVGPKNVASIFFVDAER